jgi:NSS family neurotransmitter:Na+ symporter
MMGIPVMLCEFMIGRRAQANTARAYTRLANGTPWKWIGFMGVLTAALIIGYYGVVSGWTLQYVEAAMTDQLHGSPQFFKDYFTQFEHNPWRPIFWMAVLVGITHFVVVHGIEKGIERASKFMMPVLFILLIILVVCSLMLPGAGAGVEFLFKPDFSKINGSTFLEALGQAFFSLSIAMGCLCTYASYFSRSTNLTRTAFQVAGIDTLVAIMASIIIFPAVFSAGIQPDAGPSLVFVALPSVFEEAFGAWPWASYAVSIMFYFLLVLATLTSLISLHEVPTAFLSEDFHMSRRKATTIVSVSVVLVGVVCSLSWGPLADVKLFDLNIFGMFDWVSSQILLVVGGALITCFVGWKMDRPQLYNELTSYGQVPLRRVRWIVYLLRWFAPFVILLIFLSGIGLI